MTGSTQQRFGMDAHGLSDYAAAYPLVVKLPTYWWIVGRRCAQRRGPPLAVTFGRGRHFSQCRYSAAWCPLRP